MDCCQRVIRGLFTFFAEDFLQGAEATAVFAGKANGNAQPFGQSVIIHGTDNDAAGLQLGKDAAAIANAHENEVGRGGDELQRNFAEGLFKELQAVGIVLTGLLHVGRVVQGGEAGGLGEGIDVEGLADFFEGGDEGGMSDAVAEAQTGEAVDFGEGAEENEVWFFGAADEREEILGQGQELDIGLVEGDEDVGRDLIEQLQKFLRLGEGAGGVVGIGQEDRLSCAG